MTASVPGHYLVTGGAAWLEGLSVVSAAVKVGVFPEVNEIDKQLAAHVAVEASRVPARVGTCTRRHHHDVAASHAFTTLQRNGH